MKIAVVQLGRIGDMILITPLLSEIKKLFPDCKLYVFAGPSNYSIISDLKFINEIIVVKKSPFNLLKILLKLKFTKFKYWIDPKDHFSNESRILASFVSAEIKIGFNPPGKKKVFDYTLNSTSEIHHSEIGLMPLTYFNYKIPEKLPKPVIGLNIDSINYVGNFLKEINNEFIILNISGSAEHKMWENEKWIEFLAAVKLKLPIVLIYAPKEKNRADELINSNIGLIRFVSRSIKDITAIVSKSKLVISPDTAVVHIAAAFNIPIFALYSGMDEFYKKFYPLSDYCFSVRADKNDNGIKSISVSRAVNSFEEFRKNIEM